MLKLPNFTKLNRKAQFMTVHFNFSETNCQKTDKTDKTSTSNPRATRPRSYERNRTNHGYARCQQKNERRKQALNNEIGNKPRRTRIKLS